ncbi:MAG: Uma2 family endonuclease [Candidatus Tectomicrobia bacterium]|nr:Uma2 family endonuclease [Candidatus Tectomicrobia bacterium]
MAIQTSRRLFTVAEYEQMVQAGIFREDDRLELIDGEIFARSPIGSRHAACVRRLQRLLAQILGDQALVDTQNPVVLNDASEPLPDVVVLQNRSDLYAARHPRPDDILLVVEVADTSLSYDQDVKIPAYARSDIPEVWVVDLNSASVHVYRTPTTTGYQEHIHVQRDVTLAPQAFSDCALLVARIVGD